MLGNSENMVVISPTPNEWSQNQIDEKTPMASTQQQALKCPRCDSSNTKFCYYNNYSLSQPRHFCKACKRYWTRGGTLRNVPVGGGCRKNKRVKKVSSTGPPPPPLPPATTSGAPPNPTGVQPRIDLSQPSNHVNPLFYGLPTSISDLNLPFTGGFSSSRVSGYDLQSQLTGLGLGFSSDHVQNDSGSGNGFNPIKQIQDFVTSNSLASSYPMYVPNIPPHPAMASIFSGLHQEKYFSGGVSEIKENIGFRALFPYEDLQSEMKEMKMEEGQRRLLDWNHVSCQNQMEQINPSQSDPSFHWNTPGTGSGAGAWLDPANIGSSVPSLI